ncbi:hypothetical protein ACFWPX_27945 [Nocardia sp. NPDC058518]|uniref:hypothetical protein n=1 Tax=Nocardia sp. NPDC058518 TaxID=3346534 RepID=UPI00364F0BF1
MYDRELHPGAASWFKSSAVAMIERVGGYLAILDAHGIEWERCESDAPGTVIYDDAQQVVVRPDRSRLGEPTAVSGYCAGSV